MCEECPVWDPTPNLERMREVLGFLLSHPENHDQSTWFHTNCKTTGCVAGWTAHLSGRSLIKTSPYSDTYERVALLPSEVDGTAPINPLFHVSEYSHYEPTPESLAALSVWQEEYDRAVVTVDPTPWDKMEIFWRRPELEFISTVIPCILIEDAAMIDLGISRDMARELFFGTRTIGWITITFGMFLDGHTEEYILAYWQETTTE